MVTKRSETKEPGNGPQPRRNRNVDRTLVHRDYLRRRLEGGAPATPEAYARAIEQWHQLPGAVRCAPVTVPTRGEAAPQPADVSALAPSSPAPEQE